MEYQCEKCKTQFPTQNQVLLHGTANPSCLGKNEKSKCPLCSRQKGAANQVYNVQELSDHLQDPSFHERHVELAIIGVHESVDTLMEEKWSGIKGSLRGDFADRDKQLATTGQSLEVKVKKIKDKVEEISRSHNGLIDLVASELEDCRKTFESLKTNYQVLDELQTYLDVVIDCKVELVAKEAYVEKTREKLNKLYMPELRMRQDGTLLWIIKPFRQFLRSELLQSGERNELGISPHFYSSKFGYKFCIQMRLEKEAGDFLNVHLIPMKGEYDDLLEWPLNKDVKVELFHPFTPDLIATKRFLTSSTPEAYQQPTQSMDLNQPNFVYFNDYLKFLVNDELYMNITVADPAN